MIRFEEMKFETPEQPKEPIVCRGGVDHIALMFQNVQVIRSIMQSMKKEGIEISIFDEFITFCKDDVAVDLYLHN